MTMIKYDVPPAVRHNKLRKALEEYVTPLENGFYRVTKRLPAFKKACDSSGCKTRIINLIIPVDATIYAPDRAFSKNSHDFDRKMRADMAEVESIVAVPNLWFVRASMFLLGDKAPHQIEIMPRNVLTAQADYVHSFTYKQGRIVTPTNGFSYNPTQCAGGIHFFLNVRDALVY